MRSPNLWMWTALASAALLAGCAGTHRRPKVNGTAATGTATRPTAAM